MATKDNTLKPAMDRKISTTTQNEQLLTSPSCSEAKKMLQPTLQPNINDKVLLAQATLQWHSIGVHSGLLTIGDIPVKKTS